jgi:hypothetical protein
VLRIVMCNGADEARQGPIFYETGYFPHQGS